ncbi:MAG: BsuPI-related putative proteinase inhibitor [Chloroflexota bacterium]
MAERFHEVNEHAGLANLKMSLACRPHDRCPGYLLTLRVTNVGDEPLRIRFPTSQQFDITIRNADGTRLWCWSADRSFLQMVSDRELIPGESTVYEVYWDGRQSDGATCGDGRYKATARFLGEVIGHVPPATVEMILGEREPREDDDLP